MHFKLCFKEYEYALTNEFYIDYENRFGKCARNTLRKVWFAAASCNSDSHHRLLEICCAIGDIIGQRDAAWLLWRIAKTKNPMIRLDEIEDGVERTAGVSNEADDVFAQSYHHILLGIALADEGELAKKASEARKDSEASEEEAEEKA